MKFCGYCALLVIVFRLIAVVRRLAFFSALATPLLPQLASSVVVVIAPDGVDSNCTLTHRSNYRIRFAKLSNNQLGYFRHLPPAAVHPHHCPLRPAQCIVARQLRQRHHLPDVPVHHVHRKEQRVKFAAARV